MCTDLDRSLRFYRESLGTGEPYLWEAPPLVRRAAFLPCEAGTWIELFADGVAHDGPPRAPDAAGHAHVAIAVDDVHAAFARLTAAGATVLQEPVTRTLHGDPPKQATMAFLAGPDGEVLELYRNDDL
jgi:catechol 2,3-dioxygenase-like lactoylglutathione lyase family enzyme